MVADATLQERATSGSARRRPPATRPPIVCALKDESDKVQVRSAKAEAERLGEVFPDLRVGLVYGDMPAKEK